VTDELQTAIRFIQATADAERYGQPFGVSRIPFGLYEAVARMMIAYGEQAMTIRCECGEELVIAGGFIRLAEESANGKLVVRYECDKCGRVVVPVVKPVRQPPLTPAPGAVKNED
jgi:hypothetical protein